MRLNEADKKIDFVRSVLQVSLSVVLVFLFVLTSDALAARRKVIFQLANLHQWAELEYTYDGSGYYGDLERSSQNHEFEEKYHLDIDYAILNRKLVHGRLDLDIGTNQVYEDENRGNIDRSDSSQGFNLEYTIDLQAFEQASVPFSLYSSRNQERVNEPFTRSHDQINQYHSAHLSLKNKIFPTFISYQFTESETKGLELDRYQSTKELRLSSYHNIGEFSATDLSAETRNRVSNVEGSAFDTDTDSYQLEANNTLHWTTLSQRQVLRSSYRRKRESGSTTLESDQWNERLRLRLGKALETEFSHQYRKITTTRQFRREQEDQFWIEHQLFRSLTSRYQHTVKRTEFDTGNEDSWQRLLSFSYRKSLPKDSDIRVSYSSVYSETDRNLADRTIYIGPGNPENAIIDSFFEVSLNNTDVMTDSIVVRDTVGIIPSSEYQVSISGLTTKIDFSGNALGLAPGDTVLIEYEYAVNSSIEFSTTTNSVSGSLGLFNHKYRIYGNFSQSDQDLISGKADVSSLVQQEYYRVGIETNLAEYTFGGSYSYLDSTISLEKNVEAFMNFHREREGRSFNLRLTERASSTQQREGAVSQNSPSVDKNSLMLHTNYRRRLARNTAVTLKMFLADIRGDNIEKDEASFGLLLESRWYKFLLRLNADITLELNDGQKSHEELISVALRRYF